jgi:hypothetical protein
MTTSRAKQPERKVADTHPAAVCASRRARPARYSCPILGLERAYAESCSDNSSIMRTAESLLTNAVKRLVGRICDLAETYALPLQVPEPLAYRNNHGA